MKTFLNLKSILLYSLFATFVLFNASCDDTSKPDDSKEIAEDQNEAKIDNRKDEKDAGFLVNAAEINMEEIQLGQLAQSKGSISDVKDLGKMMEADHTNVLNELNALAKTKNITLPATYTEKIQQAYEKLNEKTGKEFDKAYCDMMVKGHKDAIDVFEKASNNAEDADIKQWATATLPALRKHLEHSEACQKVCESMK